MLPVDLKCSWSIIDFLKPTPRITLIAIQNLKKHTYEKVILFIIDPAVG
jgi:hypothetical protein